MIGQVSDTGIGIPKEALDKLFHEFYRADNAKAIAAHGTGLGLAIAKQIVEGAGGTITVESELGSGSTFTFTCQQLAVRSRAHPVIISDKEAG